MMQGSKNISSQKKLIPNCRIEKKMAEIDAKTVLFDRVRHTLTAMKAATSNAEVRFAYLLQSLTYLLTCSLTHPTRAHSLYSLYFIIDIGNHYKH